MVFTNQSLVYDFITKLGNEAENIWDRLVEQERVQGLFKCALEITKIGKEPLVNLQALYECIKEILEEKCQLTNKWSLEEVNQLIQKGLEQFNNNQYNEAISNLNIALKQLPFNSAESLQSLFTIFMHKYSCLNMLHLDEQILRVSGQLLTVSSEMYKYSHYGQEIKQTHSAVVVEEDKSEQFVHPLAKLKYNTNVITNKLSITLAAKASIAKDTVIIKEKPFTILRNKLTEHCTNCDMSLDQNFWPCELCNEVIFCSKLCSDQAFELFHKYECGLVEYLLKCAPLYLQMLRFYTKCGQHPHNEFNNSRNYFIRFKRMFTGEDICESDHGILFNSFRQSMEQVFQPQSGDYFKVNYFGQLYQAIEFFLFYDICLERGARKQQEKLQQNESTNKLTLVSGDNSSIYIPFHWVGGLQNRMPIITNIFADIRRFSNCLFVYAFLPWAEKFEQGRFPSSTPVMSSILTHSKSNYNLDYCYDESGFLVVKTICDIAENQELILRSPITRRERVYKRNYSMAVKQMKKRAFTFKFGKQQQQQKQQVQQQQQQQPQPVQAFNDDVVLTSS